MMARGWKSSTRGHKVYRTAAWKRLRLVKLGRNPLCQICERRGRAVAAVTVDHKVALSKGGPWFPDMHGLVSLCDRCHKLKTARKDHGRVDDDKTRNAYAGTDTAGNPLDPDDPWNAPENVNLCSGGQAVVDTRKLAIDPPPRDRGLT